MSQFVLAQVDVATGQGGVTATDYDGSTPLAVHAAEGSDIAFGVFDDLKHLGPIPATFDDDRSYGNYASHMLLKLLNNDEGQTSVGVDVTVDGGFDLAQVGGGQGNDRLTVDAASTGRAHLYGAGGDDVLTAGNVTSGFGNQLDGGDGNDTLLGGSGVDHLDGGAGDDVINGGGGFDDVEYLLHDDDGLTVNLAREGVNAVGEGRDSLTDVEQVGAFSDVFVSMKGDRHANWLSGDAPTVTLTGGAGNDHLSATADFASTLKGGAGNDSLAQIGDGVMQGGAGDDLLDIGRGAHTLSGGVGADTFQFRAASDAVVTDFHRGDLLKLDLIDAITGTPGHNAFVLVDHLSGHAGEAAVIDHSDEGYSQVLLDTDGDGEADQTLTVMFDGHLKAADFVL